MIVRPAIAGLRSRPAPQPCVDAALARWQERPQVRRVMAALGDYGAGAALGALPGLARLLSSPARARALAGDLIAPLAAALRAEPLAQLPLGHSAAPGVARIRLGQSGRASLNLAVFARREAWQPVSVLFEDGEAHELVLAGAGQGRACRQAAQGLVCTDIACTPGTRITRRGPREARQILAVTQPLLVLQLLREAACPQPAREVAIADGALLKMISACKRTSQRMMALGVLGALEHRPALAVMARLALDGAAERDLRWEALRQVLALDSAQGLALLAELAARAQDALGPPAASLRRDLIAAHPDLATPEPA